MTEWNKDQLPEEPPSKPLEAFVYHQRKALEETGRALEELLPLGFREHSTAARKEFKRSFEVIADVITTEVEKMSQRTRATTEPTEEKPSSTGKTKVKVQVE